MATIKRHIKSISRGFVDGLSEIFDIYYYETAKKENLDFNSDRKAIESDWNRVYGDLKKSIDKFEEEESEKIKELVD